MRSCWGDLLLWFICRCKKKSNIPKILQGFRNLQKGHGGTHEPIIHISVENASRKERHSDAVKVESLERFMDTYPLAASKCHEIIFEIQLFLHAGSFLSFDSLGHVEQLRIADIQLKFYDALSRCVALAECHLTILPNLWEKKCQLCCFERLDPASCACTSRIQSTFRRNRETRLFPQDRARRRRCTGMTMVSMLKIREAGCWPVFLSTAHSQLNSSC